MDAIKNPFSPGAGSPPPELVGRAGILEQALESGRAVRKDAWEFGDWEPELIG